MKESDSGGSVRSRLAATASLLALTSTVRSAWSRAVPVTGRNGGCYEPALDQPDGAVSLVEVSETCWDRLGPRSADLSVQTDKRVRADGEQLGRFLEALFRAAVENADAWSVTVGELGGGSGFYVADDGAGSLDDAPTPDTAARDEGVAAGIADAHGWDLSVTDRRTGGTRVELTGVDLVD